VAYEGNATITTDSSNGALVVGGTEKLSVTVTGGLEVNQLKRMDGVDDFVVEQYKAALTLTDNQSSAVELSALSFVAATFGGIIVEYTITENVGVRIGRLLVVTDGTYTSIDDLHIETANVGVTWSAVVDSGTVKVKYVTTDLSVNRTMLADIKQFQAV
jgi:hypothetical protein